MLRNCWNRLPIPAGCVALGLIGLGTLLGAYSRLFLFLLGLLSFAIQICVLMKLLRSGSLKRLYADRASLSTLAGTSMAMMLTAAPMRTVLHLRIAVLYWSAGLLLHLALIIAFSVKLLRERTALSDVRGSWLLVYVGIAAAAISAPAFSAETVGRILLIPAALGAVVLLPLVYRADYLTPIPQPQRPLFCITAAPVSIWLVGYLSVAPQPSEPLVLGLLLLSQLLYIPALFRFFQTFRDPFAPSFAAFSFPFVIVATACKRAAAFLTVTASLRFLIQVEIASALVFCGFTAWKYCQFLFAREKAAV